MFKGLIRLLMAFGIGAGLMYFLDPDRGKTRRALAKDKATGLTNDARDALTGRAKDLSNRASGMIHEARKAMRGSSPSSEEMPASEMDH
jgi:hypothetical protein